MAKVTAMKAMTVTKAQGTKDKAAAPKKAAAAHDRATKNAQGTKDKAAAPKKVNQIPRSKMVCDPPFEVVLTVCRQCKEAVEIVRCIPNRQVMTFKEYYCRQGCTTCLELHAVLIK